MPQAPANSVEGWAVFLEEIQGVSACGGKMRESGVGGQETGNRSHSETKAKNWNGVSPIILVKPRSACGSDAG